MMPDDAATPKPVLCACGCGKPALDADRPYAPGHGAIVAALFKDRRRAFHKAVNRARRLAADPGPRLSGKAARRVRIKREREVREGAA